MADNSKLIATIGMVSLITGLLGLIINVLLLLLKKDDDYVVFYAKQAILFDVLGIVVGIIFFVLSFLSVFLMVIPGIGAIVGLLMFGIMLIIGLVMLALWVMGILNAFSGAKKALPIIGGFWK